MSYLLTSLTEKITFLIPEAKWEDTKNLYDKGSVDSEKGERGDP